VVSFTSDWLYPSYHSKELVGALTGAGADVTYLDIQSDWGHDAFLLEVDTMTDLLGSFLDRVVREEAVAFPLPATLSQEIPERNIVPNGKIHRVPVQTAEQGRIQGRVTEQTLARTTA